MAEDREASAASKSETRPGRTGFVCALFATTIFGSEPEKLGRWAVYFPLIGIALGALMLGADRVGAAIGGAALGSAAALAIGIGLTGARGVFGLARVLASFASPAARAPDDRSRSPLERMRDARPSTVGVLAAALAALELFCLLHLDRFRSIGLLFAPMLARAAMVVLAVGSRAARADGRQVKFAPEVTFNEFALASAATFAAVSLAADFLGLLLVLATAVLTVALRVFFHWRFGGIDRTAVHAACQATELAVLAILAAF